MENQIEASKNNPPVALVTGANQGVGFQIAKALVTAGYYLLCFRKRPNSEQVKLPRLTEEPI
ncbi:hypothetical protein GCM10028819_49440 [Spirosoma humi]